MERIKIKLIKEISEYCEYNNIDINDFVNKCIDIGFNVSKYGYSPIDNMKKEKNNIKNNIENNEKESTRKEIKESVLNEDETAKEKNIVNEDNGKHEEQTVRNTEERETGVKEEIKRDEEAVEIKPKKRRVKIIKN